MKQLFRKVHFISLDYYILFAVLTLMTLGIFFIYSSGINSEGILVSNEYFRQILWALTGIILMLIFSLVDYNKLKNASFYVYIIMLCLLVYTLFFGKVVNGAKAWISLGPLGNLQTSEFAKLGTIVFLASYLDNLKNDITKILPLLGSLFIILIPMGLTLLQPDMGTALTFFPILIAMLFFCGANLSHVMYLVLMASLTSICTILPVWETYINQTYIPILSILTDPHIAKVTIFTCLSIFFLAMSGYFFYQKRYFYWIAYFFSLFSFSLVAASFLEKILKEYQLKRLIIFVNPQVEPQMAGWNIIQSVTAVGSGGLVGKGFLKGTQSHYRFLPEQSTDFIFSIISEEMGFLGALIVFLLYSVIMVRALMIMWQTKDRFGIGVIGGIVGLFIFHIFINIGMTIGIMPVIGIPLVFLSYGGSITWTGFCAIGLILNIRQRVL